VGDFKNGWGNFRSASEGYAPAGYFKDSLGVVHLRGVVEGGKNWDFSKGVIFTLPPAAEYQPEFRTAHAVLASDGVGAWAAHVGVDTTGQVIAAFEGDRRVKNDLAPPRFISLDGVSFRAKG
jgi:hypothetical protein